MENEVEEIKEQFKDLESTIVPPEPHTEIEGNGKQEKTVPDIDIPF